MNLTQRDYAHMTRGSGFRGELNNIDVTHMGVGHIDIDKSDKLHQMVVTKIVSAWWRHAPRRAGGTPVPAPRPNTDPAAAPASKPSGENAPKPAASSTSGAATAPTAAAIRGCRQLRRRPPRLLQLRRPASPARRRLRRRAPPAATRPASRRSASELIGSSRSKPGFNAGLFRFSVAQMIRLRIVAVMISVTITTAKITSSTSPAWSQ